MSFYFFNKIWWKNQNQTEPFQRKEYFLECLENSTNSCGNLQMKNLLHDNNIKSLKLLSL